MLPKLSRRSLLGAAIALFPAARLAASPSPSPAILPDPILGLPVLAPAEWRTLANLLDQILPATAKLPTASTAGCLTYLGRRLTGDLPGYAVKGAHVTGATGENAELAAYYRRIVARADAIAMQIKQVPFAALPDSALPDSARRAVVAQLSAGSKADVGYNVVGLPTPETAPDPELFALLRRHALEGYYSDPRSGGNRGFKVWEGIGHVCHSNYPREHHCDPDRKQHR